MNELATVDAEDELRPALGRTRKTLGLQHVGDAREPRSRVYFVVPPHIQGRSVGRGDHRIAAGDVRILAAARHEHHVQGTAQGQYERKCALQFHRVVRSAAVVEKYRRSGNEGNFGDRKLRPHRI